MEPFDLVAFVTRSENRLAALRALADTARASGPAGGDGGPALAVLAVLAGARMTQTAITQRCDANALLGRDSCRAAGADAPRGAEAVDRG